MCAAAEAVFYGRLVSDEAFRSSHRAGSVALRSAEEKVQGPIPEMPRFATLRTVPNMERQTLHIGGADSSGVSDGY